MSPAPSECDIEVAGYVVNTNPSYPIEATGVINASTSHTRLNITPPTNIVNIVRVQTSKCGLKSSEN